MFATDKETTNILGLKIVTETAVSAVASLLRFDVVQFDDEVE